MHVKFSLRNCLELTKGTFLGKPSQALEERMETLSGPGAQEVEESYTCVGALGAARAATNLASDDQGAHTPFRLVISLEHHTSSQPVEARWLFDPEMRMKVF